MHEERLHNIVNKVITADDVRLLAKTIQSLVNEYIKDKYRGAKRKSLNYRLSYSIETIDDSKYSADNIDIFSDKGILDRKIVKRVKMNFYDYHDRAGITVELADSSLSYLSNTVEVEGNDSTWVNGVFHKLVDSVNAWKEQYQSIKRLRWLIALPTVWMITYTVIVVVVLLVRLFSKNSSILIFSPYLIFILASSGFAWFISDYLESLWPSIEIVPTQQQKQNLQNKRARIKYICSAVVLPFVITLIIALIVK